MNKKGVESIFWDSIGLIVLILVLFLFWITTDFIGKMADQRYYIGESEIVNPGNIILLNYLRTDVEIDLDNDGNLDKINMADLISLSYDNNNYKELLNKETKKILESLKPYTWNMEIRKENEDMILEVKTEERIGLYDQFNSYIEIPTYNNKLIKIRLYLESQNWPAGVITEKG
ncbi:hypothetical protein J4455_01015 [Candidatus Woesearchaeota archaeon]|nr:hypothetical protein [Candidatus Woesearchaeota archaeon]